MGGFLYIKNTGTAKAAYVSIIPSHVASNVATMTGTDTPTAPTGTSALNEATNITLRTMSLRPGEFAWFPWDYAGDIYASCEHSDGTSLEYWLFDRG